MALLLLAAFIGVPLIEIAVFIQVGDQIGLGATLALVVLTAVLGTWQLRRQGLATVNRVREQLDRGVMPAQELFDGVCLLFAGALLLTPGFVTDTIGFLLFLAPFRALLRRAIGSRIARYESTGQSPSGAAWSRVWVNGEEVTGRGPRDRTGRSGRNEVIDGDYRDVTPEPEGGNGETGPGEMGEDRASGRPALGPEKERTK